MENMKKFIKSLKHILPCPTCKKNMKRHMEELPLTADILKSRAKLVMWFVDIHNLVNKETGKKKMTYDEAQNSLLSLYLSD